MASFTWENPNFNSSNFMDKLERVGNETGKFNIKRGDTSIDLDDNGVYTLVVSDTGDEQVDFKSSLKAIFSMLYLENDNDLDMDRIDELVTNVYGLLSGEYKENAEYEAVVKDDLEVIRVFYKMFGIVEKEAN